MRFNDFELVLMVADPRERRRAGRLLNRVIGTVELSVNDGWVRDSGPVFAVNDEGARRVSGFTFNGWGARFPPYRDDALLKALLCAHPDIPTYAVDLVLEGGVMSSNFLWMWNCHT